MPKQQSRSQFNETFVFTYEVSFTVKSDYDTFSFVSVYNSDNSTFG
jgi:hypothetical protein